MYVCMYVDNRKGDDESRKEDLKCVRDWAMKHNPPESMSSHWWYVCMYVCMYVCILYMYVYVCYQSFCHRYRELGGDAKDAFDRCSQASQIRKMFRSLFSERYVCMYVCMYVQCM